MDFDQVLYKYRDFSARSLKILINRELYFASPDQLNDPFDCQISIRGALEPALQRAISVSDNRGRDRLIRLRDQLSNRWEQMEGHIRSAGVLSLVRDDSETVHPLMWAHYADSHRGFRLGFRFPELWSENRNGNQMIGRKDVDYCFVQNPFVQRFLDVAGSEGVPSWDEFWLKMLVTGMTSKSQDWKYETEERVLRKGAGVVPFDSSYLVEVVFGGRMSPEDEGALRNLLNHRDWSHVRRKRAVRPANHDFGVEIVDA